MASFQTRLRVFSGFVRSCVTETQSDSLQRERFRLQWRRVLIVEFRDEVFAALKSLFEAFGVRVDRAEREADVPPQVQQKRPDLVLISGTMPDESAWLISAKVRMQSPACATWLYMPRIPPARSHWMEFASAAAIIEYDGVVSTLLDNLRCRLRSAEESGRILDATATAAWQGSAVVPISA